MKKVISVIFKSDFGFFRKPDANNMINLSYNMAHKPAILGILGAIIGLDGYKNRGEKPDYLARLGHLKIGIEPVQHDKGNFRKTVIKYSNTIGYANNGDTYLTEEATLIKPSYKIYIYLDISNQYDNKLYHNLMHGYAEYIPYFGKNEFNIWWDKNEVVEYTYKFIESKDKQQLRIHSIFQIDEEGAPMTPSVIEESALRRDRSLGLPFLFFERIPIGFQEEFMQYKLEKFVYSNFKFQSEGTIDNLYLLNEDTYVQLN